MRTNAVTTKINDGSAGKSRIKTNSVYTSGARPTPAAPDCKTLKGPGAVNGPHGLNLDFARDVVNGFSRKEKSLPSRWFYDDEGSRLFATITQLPEYYLTKREAEILSVHGSQFARDLGSGPWQVVELGAGDGSKTEILLRAFLSVGHELIFHPLDVSKAALDELCHRMKRKLPALNCDPIEGDNLESLAQLSMSRTGRICLLFLGSSIGNCTRAEVDETLKNIRSCLRSGDKAIIGFDLIKQKERLIQAYSDNEGVTRDFNLNLLDRMNRELGANFDRSRFKHVATWNSELRGMESWLVSLCDQTVRFERLGQKFSFREGEQFQTETSLKFTIDELPDLAMKHGFISCAQYTDEAGDFVDVIWEATTQGHEHLARA